MTKLDYIRLATQAKRESGVIIAKVNQTSCFPLFLGSLCVRPPASDRLDQAGQNGQWQIDGSQASQENVSGY